MVTAITNIEFKALTYDYIPHLKLELGELSLYLFMVEKGTVVTKSFLHEEEKDKGQLMIISNQTTSWISKFVADQVHAYKVLEEVAGTEEQVIKEKKGIKPLNHESPGEDVSKKKKKEMLRKIRGKK